MSTAIHSLVSNFKTVQQASKTMVQLSGERVNSVLETLSEAVISHSETILQENQKDLERMSIDDPKYDRLQLTTTRLQDIAREIRKVASLPNPIGTLLEERTMDNGMHISKVTVPLGVIGVIFEARPNVTFDVFALCLKSGNACILKGGSDAAFAIVKPVFELMGKNITLVGANGAGQITKVANQIIVA